MASNIADLWLFFPTPVAGTVVTAIDFTAAAVKQAMAIPSRCQVKEWGVIVTIAFVGNAVDPIVALRRKPLITGTSATLQSLTLGSSNTLLRKYTNNPDAVAAGGPGVVTTGPSIGGHTTPLSADTDLVAGTVVIADGRTMPSTMLNPGDALIVEVTTAATTGGSGVVFVRLEVPGEVYTPSNVYTNYDAIP